MRVQQQQGGHERGLSQKPLEEEFSIASSCRRPSPRRGNEYDMRPLLIRPFQSSSPSGLSPCAHFLSATASGWLGTKSSHGSEAAEPIGIQLENYIVAIIRGL